MIEIINNLKEKEIIYRKSVEILKQYITKKHPDADETYRARVFADAVHKIIDDHIKTFNRKDQKIIKSALLAAVADKAVFEISAYDIMKTCVSLDMNEDDFVQDLTSWLNQEQSIPVNNQILIDITFQVKEEIHKENEILTIDREAAALLSQLEAAFMANEKEFDGYKVMDPADAQMTFFNNDFVDDEDEEENGDLRLGSDESTYTTYERRELNIENAFYEGTVEETETFIDKSPIVIEVDTSEVLETAASIGKVTEVFEAEGITDISYTGDDEDAYEDIIRLEDDLVEELESLAEEPKVFVDSRPVIVVERDRQMDLLIHRSNTLSMNDAPKKWYEILWTYVKSGAYKEDLRYIIPIVLGFIMIIVVLLFFVNQSKAEVEVGTIDRTYNGRNDMMMTLNESTEDIGKQAVSVRAIDASHLDPSIKYKQINKVALVQWLEEKNAVLAEDRYIDNLLEVASEYGVNPLLLVAITGQEQAFVPKNHPDAMEMINNPFNVYESWELYNTDFDEATRIAARTILTASENKPDDQAPIEWINKRYAQDPKWYIGVTLFFEELEEVAGKIE